MLRDSTRIFRHPNEPCHPLRSGVAPALRRHPLHPMTSFSRSRWFFGFLCVLLIVGRMSGAHWHLCFDHSEPPLSVHLGDPNSQSGGAGHQDTDLDWLTEAIVKTFAAHADIWLLGVWMLLTVGFTGALQSLPLPVYRGPAPPRRGDFPPASPRAPPL